MSRRSITLLPLISLVYFSVVVPASAQDQEVSLPEGPGKPLVEAFCTSCHALTNIPRSGGYTREHWQALLANMVDLSGRPEQDMIVDYLATNFPPTTVHRPTLVSGEESISFKGWKVPTLGQQARDPVEAPDGSLFWSGHWGDLVGRIDPQTSEIKEFRLAPGTQPHSVTSDTESNIWFMGQRNGTVGKVDPDTGEITVYNVPDSRVNPERPLDPHTGVFHPNGNLFFTMHVSNRVGRLNPATGEIKQVDLPWDIRPYDIKVDSEGALWMGCNRPKCSIFSMDPETMELREYPLPRPETLARRIAFASDGMIWFANTGLGAVGRLDPKTGEVKEWTSPSGPDSRPYALEVIDDIVWYNESGKRPDALVRFDPKTEQFQSWPIPSTDGVYGGLLRNMMVTRDGNLVIHTGSTNEIVLVTLNAED